MKTTFTLIDSQRARYLTGAMMYFAQGIPRGLLGIAIPAWLVSQGVGAVDGMVSGQTSIQNPTC